MTEVWILVAVLAVTGALALLWKRRDGRAVAATGMLSGVVRARLGAPEGRPMLLLFTSPTCRHCGAARRVLQGVSRERPGVAIAEVDVAEDAPLAREHRILRAPTVLVVGPRGEIRARVSGVPVRDDLVQVLAG